MGHQRKERERRSSESSIGAGSALYYWSVGKEAQVEMSETSISTSTTPALLPRNVEAPQKKSNNIDVNLFIRESVCGSGGDSIRCCCYSCHPSDHHQHHYFCSKNSENEYGNCSTSRCNKDGGNMTVQETIMFRYNNNKDQPLPLHPENHISVSSNSFGSSSPVWSYARETTSDLEKMVRKRKKNSLLTLATTATTSTTTTSRVQPIFLIKDSERKKKKKKSIKRDTDEVDMSSVDESVLTPASLRQFGKRRSSSVTSKSGGRSSSSSSSPLNNLVSCFTSWPFILEKYIRLGHLFMTPEAKSVPFRESSKTLDDKCGNGDEVDMTAQEYQAKDNYVSLSFLSSTQDKSQSIVKAKKEIVLSDDDTRENSCRYRSIPNITNNNKAHCQHEQPYRQQHKQKSRKRAFLPVFWIIALVTGSWINPCFAQGKPLFPLIMYVYFLDKFSHSLFYRSPP